MKEIAEFLLGTGILMDFNYFIVGYLLGMLTIIFIQQRRRR